MKKLMAILTAILLVCAVGCKEDDKIMPGGITCEQILNAVYTTAPYGNTTTYIKDKNDMDADTMSKWATGAVKEFAEYELLADYAICYSNDISVYDIAVLKANSKDDVKKLENVVNKRIATLRSSKKATQDPNFERMISEAKVLVSDKYVILIITQNNNAAEKAINNLKQ